MKKTELNFQGSIEQLKQVWETRSALMSSLTTWGTNTLRGIFLLHCGAAIAIIARFDTLQSKQLNVYGFVRGAMFAVISAGFMYLSELFISFLFLYTTNKQLRKESINSTWASVLIYASILFFIPAISYFIGSCYMFILQVGAIEEYFNIIQNNATLHVK
jgi:hypothetical protein